MITSITNGQKVYRHRKTSAGLYLESFRVSEMTGRKLDLITVVPEYVWGKPESPYYNSFQVPAKDLIDEQEMQRLSESTSLHPAMTICGLCKADHLAEPAMPEKPKIASIKVLNIFCEVTVKPATLEPDLKWQPYAIYFWQRLLDQAPTD